MSRGHKREIINNPRETRCKKNGCEVPANEKGWRFNITSCRYCGKRFTQKNRNKSGVQ